MDRFVKLNRAFGKWLSVTIFVLCVFITCASAQDVRLKIIEQPKPELPQNYQTLDVQGTVLLRVQFLDFGDIGEVIALKTLPSGLTEKAVAAARKIRCEPEKKAGKAVTSVRELQYYYSWNGGWRFPSENAALATARP